jgi:two-component system LytT family response regulator
VNALDYLLKPVNPERLKESINRLGNPYNYDSKFVLKAGDKILIDQFNSSKFISVNSINYIKAHGDYSMVYTQDNTNGLIHHTLKKWIERLPSKLFKQVHRSYIVNLDHIEKLTRKENNTCEITLADSQTTIPVSRNYTKSLRAVFTIK